jgi:hypothetical protein
MVAYIARLRARVAALDVVRIRSAAPVSQSPALKRSRTPAISRPCATERATPRRHRCFVTSEAALASRLRLASRCPTAAATPRSMALEQQPYRNLR